MTGTTWAQIRKKLGIKAKPIPEIKRKKMPVGLAVITYKRKKLMLVSSASSSAAIARKGLKFFKGKKGVIKVNSKYFTYIDVTDD